MDTRHRIAFRLGLVAAATLAATIAACSGSDSADQGASGTNSTSGNGSSSGDVTFDGGSSGSGTIDPDAACAKATADATLQSVDMFVMFDDSGSMNDNDKWTNASAALIAFFQDPTAAGLSVTLRFFPDGACDDNNCDVMACSQPEVPLGALTIDPAPTDAQEQVLVTAVQNRSPGNGGGTPLSAALQGAESWATTYAAAHPAEKVVVVLVTDGEPNGCDEDINNIAQAAASAQSSGIATYAVGLQGSNIDQMNQIAQAGGTQMGFFIGNGNAQADLLAALKTIQGGAVSCSFPVPKTSNTGEPIDPSQVNVNYTPNGSGMAETLTQVMGASACGSSGGWYYDNPTQPTTITLCPSTCSSVQGDAQAAISLLFGCASKTTPN